MANINDLCADAGTPGCPCPLSETGDCLVCGRLSAVTAATAAGQVSVYITSTSRTIR